MITVMSPGLKSAEFRHVNAAMAFAKARGGTLNFRQMAEASVDTELRELEYEYESLQRAQECNFGPEHMAVKYIAGVRR